MSAQRRRCGGCYLVGGSPKATPSLQNGTCRPGIPLLDQRPSLPQAREKATAKSCRNTNPRALNHSRFSTKRTGRLNTDCHRFILIQVRCASARLALILRRSRSHPPSGSTPGFSPPVCGPARSRRCWRGSGSSGEPCGQPLVVFSNSPFTMTPALGSSKQRYITHHRNFG